MGRKPIFLVALAVLPVRGVLFSFTSSPAGVVAIQLLDGVAAGIFGVVSVVIAADLMKGTGRFNLAQGLVALAVGIGVGLSNAVAGYVVQAFGYPAGFLSLAALAVGALAFFAILMPETGGGEKAQGPRPKEAPRRKTQSRSLAGEAPESGLNPGPGTLNLSPACLPSSCCSAPTCS